MKLTKELDFTQSKIDACVFYRGKTKYVEYTDESILASPDQKEIDQIIIDLRKAKLDITVVGDLQNFLGVNIKKRHDGPIHMTQLHLIDQVLNDLRMTNGNVNIKNIPAASPKILSSHTKSKDFDNSFH